MRPNDTTHSSHTAPNWIPTTRQEMNQRGWKELDILLVSGDAYIDHPSFGIPLLARWLEKAGYKVGIVAQPHWDTTDDIQRMGRPRLFCGISAGSLDSMLCHYTAFRKKRHDDAYTPGGLAGARPNRATIVYANLVRAAFPGLPVVLGGVEASLRKLAHYDFWTDALRRALLFDAKADLLLYGMGERSILEVAHKLENNLPLENINGSARIIQTPPENAVVAPAYEEIMDNHALLIEATQLAERHVHNPGTQLVQKHGNRYILLEPPSPPLAQDEMDQLYNLPFIRDQHPSYTQRIPALDMIKWSITAVRGCGGACSFCSIAQHQGRKITSRSRDSILNEAVKLSQTPGWKGNISDIGGPTANFWGASCKINAKNCRRESCMTPEICPNFILKQTDFLKLLQDVKALPFVKTVAVASGIRHDAAIKDKTFMEGLVKDFVAGHLKLAPEHCQDNVLKLMRKPSFAIFEQFLDAFQKLSDKFGKKQFIVPYIISAFPGCTMEDMKACANWFRQKHWQPQQVQCFIPTPGTIATAMFFAQKNTIGNELQVPLTDRDRLQQHGLLFPKDSAESTPNARQNNSSPKTNGQCPDNIPNNPRKNSQHRNGCPQRYPSANRHKPNTQNNGKKSR